MVILGILRETKIPPDRRVAMTPDDIIVLKNQFKDFEVIVQPSEIRGYKDEEYKERGIKLQEDLSPCDVLLGVKEANPDTLLPGKTYMFFSHTAKKQPHNQVLMKEMVKKKITMIDLEYLTDENGMRLAAFGRWAGIVGAYNGLRAYGLRNELYTLKPAYTCFDKNALFRELHRVFLPEVKILITGGGRVASGVKEVLAPLEISRVSPKELLNGTEDQAVYCQVEPEHYVKRKDGGKYSFTHFVNSPADYESDFYPYLKITDLLMASHYWDPRSPVFFTREEMQDRGFNISVIADISCDVNGPIPSTIRSTTIEEPFYGYDPVTGKETDPFEDDSITVMAVDNLPGELPRDASSDFGRKLVRRILPGLIENDPYGVIKRATILKNGELTDKFKYLMDYARL